MFEFTNEVTGNVNNQKLWGFYANVEKWSEWDSGVIKVELHGGFKTGTTGVMFMADKGVTTIRHTVSIIGGSEGQIQGIGAGISRQIPDSMKKLVEIAK